MAASSIKQVQHEQRTDHKYKTIPNWTRKTVWLLTNNTSSNQRLWECVRCRVYVYPDTLNDFPSWLSTSKNKPFVSNNRAFTERHFSDKVHASLMIEHCVAWRRQFPVGRRLTSLIGLKNLHQFWNFVLNIVTLTCNV